jgi:diguanylate cyclase (GGDEF)-like protein
MRTLDKLSKWIAVILFMLIASTLSVFLHDFYTIITKNTTDAAEDHLLQNTRTSSTIVREKIQSDLDTVYTLAKLFSNFDSLNSPEAKALLKSLGNEYPFSILLVKSNDGTYYTNSGSDINLRNTEYLLGTKNSDLGISVVYKNALYDRDMIALESSIYHDGKLAGTISGLYYTNYIYNILNTAENQNTHQYQIIDRTGNFILSSGMSMFYEYDDLYSFLNASGFQKVNKDKVVHDFVGGRPGVTFFKKDGKISYFCYMPIGINNWYLISQAPELGIDMQAITVKNPTVLLSLRIIVLFIILILYIVWRQIRYRVGMEASRSELERLNERLQAKNETLKVKAENDLLTGLYNKVTTELVITDFLQTDGKEDRHALFVIDLDDFKRINDELGHIYGDKALTEVADAISHCLRTTDVKGRIGGDEFLVLLKFVKSDTDIIQKAEEIIKKLNGIRILYGSDWTIGASIGIAVYPEHSEKFTELFRKADKSLYFSKEHGKGTYCIYRNEIDN